MIKSEINKEAYRLLQKNLTDRKLLKSLSISQKKMLQLIKDGNWTDKIDFILSTPTVSCRKVADSCSYFASSPDAPKGHELLQYVYNNTLSQLFPTNFISIKNEQFEDIRLIFSTVLRTFLTIESRYQPFEFNKHFETFHPKEALDQTIKEEYTTFLSLCNHLYFYEFLRISSEVTPFDTLGHVASVHYVAVSMAKQLRLAGAPVDIPLVSAAAATHDIGKFGCKKSEARRVPYLHYFYTLQCTQYFGMPTIGHIAANHSTWDLELENLSIENLLLIYADFRSKSTRDENGKETAHIYTLKESFDVILEKLDNVDLAKTNRYKAVYAKLVDFESYCISLGVHTDFSSLTPSEKISLDYNLMNSKQTVDQIKNMAIEHNIYVMHKLNNEATLGNVLEAARSEKDWKNLRAYINVFDEYCTYMTKKQKNLTIHFLQELLAHREGDIRRASAVLIGKMISEYDQEYRKELPEDVILPVQTDTSNQLLESIIQDVLIPDHKMTDQHRRWVGYTLKRILESLFENSTLEKQQTYITIFLSFFSKKEWDEWATFVLIDTSVALPFQSCTKEQLKQLMFFMLNVVPNQTDEIQLSALRLCDDMIAEAGLSEIIYEEAVEFLQRLNFHKNNVSIDYLLYKTKNDLGLLSSSLEEKNQLFFENEKVLSEIFLENLKGATPWIFKVVNIRLLKDQITQGNISHVLHVATHLANLVKVSERVTVRKRAGAALVTIMPYLSLDQRNEISVELLRGLEIGEYQFSKYIPDYLGEILLYLHPDELDEVIKELEIYVHSTNTRIVNVALKTIAVMLRNYPAYQNRFEETSELNDQRFQHLFGLLTIGLANYKEEISLEAFYVIGHELFGSTLVTMWEKHKSFQILHKKMITLLLDQSDKELALYIRAAALNHIYRYISLSQLNKEPFYPASASKIAFFPGTFDPFSLGHKGMVQQIRNCGFEVYLALDEFSWSKKTQPRLLRRKIITMSIADEKDVYLFPDQIPVNLSNPKDLQMLTEMFPDKELYIVTGSDVIANASAYKATPEEYSIHQMNHLIFSRPSSPTSKSDIEAVVHGKIEIFELDNELEDVSSTRIRNNIDLNRDITNLIDPMAQNFIYENGLYMREPQYKRFLDQDSLCFHFKKISETHHAVVASSKMDPSLEYGTLIYHRVYNAQLLEEFQDLEIVSYIRSHSSGSMIVMDQFTTNENAPFLNLQQALLAEALSQFLMEEFSCVLCHFKNTPSDQIRAIQGLFERHGFLSVPHSTTNCYISMVDMRYPLVVIRDVETVLKEPLSKNARVRETIHKTNEKLQGALTSFYPGSLVLAYSSNYMQQRLLEKITSFNEVPLNPVTPKILGDQMCVPFGNILRDTLVPNTITKALHTAKIYEPDASFSQIEESLNYSPLSTQIRTINAFNRPVILVDDLLHNGARLQKLTPLFKNNSIPISKVMVGIMSGTGKDLMDSNGQSCESIYFIPNMRHWFTISSLYPFIGGDTVRREYQSIAGISPAINMILPFVANPFFKDTSKEALYQVSLTCLKNAKHICRVLEEEYQQEFERNLTLNRLSEVMRDPCFPDVGIHVKYELNQPPSAFIENSIEQLERTRNLTLF